MSISSNPNCQQQLVIKERRRMKVLVIKAFCRGAISEDKVRELFVKYRLRSL